MADIIKPIWIANAISSKTALIEPNILSLSVMTLQKIAAAKNIKNSGATAIVS